MKISNETMEQASFIATYISDGVDKPIDRSRLLERIAEALTKYAGLRTREAIEQTLAANGHRMSPEQRAAFEAFISQKKAD